MPLEAKKMAPVTRNECPVNLSAPESVCEGRPKDCAKLRTVWTMAFLVATISCDFIVGNKRDELRAEDCDEVH